jgi:hypothetical protein
MSREVNVGRAAALAVIACVVSVSAGYAAGRGSSTAAPPLVAGADRGEDLELGAPSMDDDALRACEARLSRAEEALARRPATEASAAVALGALPEEDRAALASPAGEAAIEAEVERRMAARFEREREQRREEWAARREDARERMRAIGIDDEALAQVTPPMCAIRDVYRQAWQSRRAAGGAAGGDAGVRTGRRELREATRELREEIERTLGPERNARLEGEGGLRALGMGIDCGEEAR